MGIRVKTRWDEKDFIVELEPVTFIHYGFTSLRYINEGPDVKITVSDFINRALDDCFKELINES